ncbi:MAG: DUF4956 domain-containing protein [Lachnospiraceae bacterium]|nr:DUF4956 domain-containing protein [Lachnospiraceae bacterium]
MLSQFFTVSVTELTVMQFLLCTLYSLVLGLLIALIHIFKNRFTKNFILTLLILPAIVQTVILLVNGNLGTGIAVMGAFSLVRFRSAPGNSREIASIFLAMAAGLAVGTGYLGVAGLLVLCVGAVILLLQLMPLQKLQGEERELKISIPENLDYEGLFEDLLAEYTSQNSLTSVKTTNMGSLFELHYKITLKTTASTQKMINDIRCRNGNLPVVLHYAHTSAATEEL